MEIHKFILYVLLSCMIFVSCSDDDKSQAGFVRYMVTVDNYQSGTISQFTYDDNTLLKLSPPINHKAKYARAIIDFSIINGENKTKSDGNIDADNVYYIRLHRISEVLTKSPLYVAAEDQQKQDNLGYDPVVMSSIWESDGYLNFQFGAMSGIDNISHFINLVSSIPFDQINSDDIVKLEFRHNKMGDNEYNRLNSYASFDLKPFRKKENGVIKFDISWIDLLTGKTKTRRIEYKYSAKKSGTTTLMPYFSDASITDIFK